MLWHCPQWPSGHNIFWSQSCRTRTSCFDWTNCDPHFNNVPVPHTFSCFRYFSFGFRSGDVNLPILKPTYSVVLQFWSLFLYISFWYRNASLHPVSVQLRIYRILHVFILLANPFSKTLPMKLHLSYTHRRFHLGHHNYVAFVLPRLLSSILCNV